MIARFEKSRWAVSQKPTCRAPSFLEADTACKALHERRFVEEQNLSAQDASLALNQ